MTVKVIADIVKLRTSILIKDQPAKSKYNILCTCIPVQRWQFTNLPHSHMFIFIEPEKTVVGIQYMLLTQPKEIKALRDLSEAKV